ncbi:MAG: tagaturonate reductase, partial [Clostridia bacterium]|nr:tagaturonate reductase [Clostridia bacterium]
VPTLTLPEEELKDYAGAVLERFANPYIRHYWKSISLNSVSKWKVRVLPSLVAYREKFGKLPDGLTASLGYLIKLYKSGMATDAEDVIAFMQEKSVAEILANEAFWDMDLSFLLDAVEEYAK